jgi:hypothetical protein
MSGIATAPRSNGNIPSAYETFFMIAVVNYHSMVRFLIHHSVMNIKHFGIISSLHALA